MAGYTNNEDAFSANGTGGGFGFTHPLGNEKQRSLRLGYFAATSFVDAQIGRVLAEVRCAVFTMDSAGLGLASSGCIRRTVRVFRQVFTRSYVIEFHAFASLEALPCVGPMAFLSGVHSSYRLTL
jgi:hypothetical protein